MVEINSTGHFKSVLIVDDDVNAVELLRDHLLEVTPYIKIQEVDNGHDALGKIHNQQFDLLITDINMPRMDGVTLVMALRTVRPSMIPKNVLVVSAYDMFDELKASGKKLHIIEKPFRKEELTKYFSKVLISKAESDYFKIPANTVLQYCEKFPFDIYLRLSAKKIIKLGHKNEERIETIKNYVDKGVTEFYVIKNEYVQFLKKMKDDLDKKISDSNKTQQTEDFIKILETGHNMLKEAFIRLDLSQESIELAKEVSLSAVKIITKTPNIFNFFQTFKSKCSHEFIISMITGYLGCCMIDKASWSSEPIKFKLTLASFLCDVTLDKNDFEELNQYMYHPTKLSSKVFEHPKEISKILEKQRVEIPSDVFTIIRQHHERPDGSGFPYALTFNDITALSAYHIIARTFVERMVKAKFNYQAIKEILKNIKEEYNKGSFNDAIHSLELNLVPSDEDMNY